MEGSGAVTPALVCCAVLMTTAAIVVWALLRAWQRHSDDIEGLREGRDA